MTDNAARFERDRLAYFSSHGADLQTQYIEDRHGRPICYLESEGTGVPLLMVHGGGANAIVWAPIAGALAEGGRKIIVVDRPGCGLSYPLLYGSGDYIQQATEFMEDVITALPAARVDLAGNSMGGLFCLAVAMARPNLIRKMVLLGAPAGLDKWLPYALRVMSLRPVQWLIENGTPMDAEGLRTLHGRILSAHPERLDQEYLETSVLPLPGTVQSWHSLLRVFAGLSGTQIMIREEPARIAVETRFVWGTADAFAPTRSGQELAARMPNADFIEVEGAGHLPWLDEPEACAKATLAFLGGIASQARAA